MQNPLNYIGALPKKAIKQDLNLAEALILTAIVISSILTLIAILAPNALKG